MRFVVFERVVIMSDLNVSAENTAAHCFRQSFCSTVAASGLERVKSDGVR